MAGGFQAVSNDLAAASAGPTAVNATVDLPVVLNGQIMPGQVDRYPFRARRGQKLVIAVEARHLIPYLADAVPGWFQAVAALYDAKGDELAVADHYRFIPSSLGSRKSVSITSKLSFSSSSVAAFASSAR